MKKNSVFVVAAIAVLSFALAFPARGRAQSLTAASTPPAAGGFGRIDTDNGIQASRINLLSVPEKGIAGAGGEDGYGDRAIIICWHTFLSAKSVPTDFSLAELESQLDSIFELGYRFIDLRDALAGRISGKLNVVATIDDGHRTVPAAVEKVFAPRGIKPALFLYPAIIGTTDFAMKDAEVEKMIALGCWTGSHGYHHLFINDDLYRASRADFNKEIFKSKLKTEELTKRPALCIAYPYGAVSAITKSEAKRAGYCYGLSVRDGFIYADPRLNDEFELPRFVVTRQNWPELLALLRRNAAAQATAVPDGN